MKNNFNIRIIVTTNYLKEQSAPDENRYVFSYTINIKNLGNNSAKLISRQWIITDSNGNIQEVNGDGVVTHGEHGTLKTESKNVIKYVQQELNPVTRKIQNAVD